MPTYEYRCKDCGHQFEVVQSFTDDALTECPTCKGNLRKVFGNVAVTFKGSGFYRNDSRGSSSSSSTSTSPSSDSGSSSDSSSSSTSSSDSGSTTATPAASSTTTSTSSSSD